MTFPAWIGRVCAGALVGLVAGCTTEVSGTGSDQSAAGQRPSGVSTAAAPRAGGDLVRRVAVADADLTGGARARLLNGGDEVEGQVTLDLCGFPFGSEADRTARWQVLVVPPGGESADGGEISNEVVAYDSPAHAAAALAEWRAAVARCPHGTFEDSDVAGEPDLRYDVLTEKPDAGLPVRGANSVTTYAVTVRDSGERAFGLILVQQRGTVLDLVYATAARPVAGALAAQARRLAGVTGKRLLALA